METFKTSGVCSRTIEYEIDGNTIKSVKFIGGCPGNTIGVSRLVKGKTIGEVISILEGVPCRNGTSCPDQLTKALKEYKAKHNI